MQSCSNYVHFPGILTFTVEYSSWDLQLCAAYDKIWVVLQSRWNATVKLLNPCLLADSGEHCLVMNFTHCICHFQLYEYTQTGVPSDRHNSCVIFNDHICTNVYMFMYWQIDIILVLSVMTLAFFLWFFHSMNAYMLVYHHIDIVLVLSQLFVSPA